MTGEVIRLVAFKRGPFDCQQAVPGGPDSERRNAGIIELRTARIARLLTELEQLTRLPGSRPLVSLDQARAGLEKARQPVRPWNAIHQARPASNPEEDPQPELDDERIERMYRELNQDG